MWARALRRRRRPSRSAASSMFAIASGPSRVARLPFVNTPELKDMRHATVPATEPRSLRDVTILENAGA
jgi:hypothetical protein